MDSVHRSSNTLNRLAKKENLLNFNNNDNFSLLFDCLDPTVLPIKRSHLLGGHLEFQNRGGGKLNTVPKII